MNISKKSKNAKPSSAKTTDTEVVSANFDDGYKRFGFGGRLKRVFKSRTFLYLVALVVITGVSYFFLTGGFNRNTIVIGSSKVTKKDINDYAKLLAAYEKAHPGTSFSGNLNQYATDKLILNAALKQEAKKYN